MSDVNVYRVVDPDGNHVCGPYSSEKGLNSQRAKAEKRLGPLRVQKLEARLVFDENLIITGAKLEWVDVDG